MSIPVNAPMVGKILNVVARVGDHVAEDDTLLVMEAMKMEIEVVAPATGTISSISVVAGDAVNPNTVLAVID